MDFLRYTVTDADSNSCNSLEGIDAYSDQDVCYLQTTNRFYRFFAASTTAPDGVTVIAPSNVTPPAPGRWFVQGPPGSADIVPGFPAALACPPGVSAVYADLTIPAAGAETQVVFQLEPTFPWATYSLWNGFASKRLAAGLLDGVVLQVLSHDPDGTPQWYLEAYVTQGAFQFTAPYDVRVTFMTATVLS